MQGELSAFYMQTEGFNLLNLDPSVVLKYDSSPYLKGSLICVISKFYANKKYPSTP